MRHLEEGEIHAWLDGAVDSEEAGRIEAHAANCEECAADVATARGLIAGASRILLALDNVPGGVIPIPASGSPVPNAADGEMPERPVSDIGIARLSMPSRGRQSPWFARPSVRIAAGLMLAVGIGALATRDRTAQSEKVTVDFRTETVGTALPPAPAAVAPSSSIAGQEEAAATSRRDVTADASGGGASLKARSPAAKRSVDVTFPATDPRVGASESRPGPTSVATTGSVSARSNANSESAPPREAAFGIGRSAAAFDSTSTARRADQTRLTDVVVSGSARGVAAPPRQAPVLAAMQSVASTDLGGACFALDVVPDSASAGIPLLPRRMRIRLAESPTVEDALAQSRSRVGASSLQGSVPEPRATAPAPSRSYAAPTSEPAEALAWQPMASDSLVARWMTTVDLVLFRLEVTGDRVNGSASAQMALTPPARVTGRRVPCGGGL